MEKLQNITTENLISGTVFTSCSRNLGRDYFDLKQQRSHFKYDAIISYFGISLQSGYQNIKGNLCFRNDLRLSGRPVRRLSGHEGCFFQRDIFE